MIEMALILPIYLLMVMAMVQFIWVLFGYCNATYAAHQAAKYASTHGTGSTYTCTTTDIKAVATQYLWGVPKNGVTITTNWPAGGSSPNTYIWVKVTIVYPTGIPFSQIANITVGAASTTWVLQ